MANAPKYDKWLQVRADQELLDILDDIGKGERPVMSRSDVVRKLVYEQDRKRRKGEG